MPTIFMLPIESLDMRYSSQWSAWFTAYIHAFKKFDLHIVQAPVLTTEITNGAFLDVCGTNYYKALQLAECCKLVHEGKVKDGDFFLLHDAWFPGVEMLAYMRDALGIKFKIAGCFHAGTYDETDYISKKGMGAWGEDLENSWLIIYDKLFVATNYHKTLIETNRKMPYIPEDLIDVTGFPLLPPAVDETIPKENIVVFPHRLTEDKQPERFDDLRNVLQAKYPHWQFIKTQEHKLAKPDYYTLLNRSKISVSFATHENWGIGMQESVMCGCIPVVPNRLSYMEMYPRSMRYNHYEEATEYVEKLIIAYDKGKLPQVKDWGCLRRTIISNGANAILNMLECLYEEK